MMSTIHKIERTDALANNEEWGNNRNFTENVVNGNLIDET